MYTIRDEGKNKEWLEEAKRRASEEGVSLAEYLRQLVERERANENRKNMAK